MFESSFSVQIRARLTIHSLLRVWLLLFFFSFLLLFFISFFNGLRKKYIPLRESLVSRRSCLILFFSFPRLLLLPLCVPLWRLCAHFIRGSYNFYVFSSLAPNLYTKNRKKKKEEISTYFLLLCSTHSCRGCYAVA